jgi:hypothetical protein
LNDERLFDRYLAERSGETPDPPSAEHLVDCAECSARYDELVRLLDGVRDEAEAETDEVFTAERLRMQQQQIARKLELVGRPARVISFPSHYPAASLGRSRTHGVARWLYAAAAACFIVGIGAGAWYDSAWRSIRTRDFTPHARLTPIATNGASPAPDAAADDAFLSDLEMALERPRTRELAAFDDLTPHARDIVDRR